MIRPTRFTALVLKRKAPFYQWLEEANRKAMVTDTDTFYKGDYGTYLVKDVITTEELDEFILKNHPQILRNELGEWHDETFWPANPDISLFRKFFDVWVHRQVYEVER